jgi:general secretion pathway protein I
MRQRQTGFTLIEVLVALAIVGIALVAGLQATMALSNHAQRQSDLLLAQLCAENELVRLRLSRRMPPVGEASFTCEQAGRSFAGRLSIRATPNPNFRRVDAQVLEDDHIVLRVATIVGSLP